MAQEAVCFLDAYLFFSPVILRDAVKSNAGSLSKITN